MKIIDLLNKIANGKTPPKIKFKNTKPIFEYNIRNGKYEYCYKSNKGKNEICELTFLNLKDEIEIIEEDKPIEKIKMVGCNVRVPFLNGELVGTDTPLALETTIVKVNELIDKLNKLEERESEK